MANQIEDGTNSGGTILPEEWSQEGITLRTFLTVAISHSPTGCATTATLTELEEEYSRSLGREPQGVEGDLKPMISDGTLVFQNDSYCINPDKPGQAKKTIFSRVQKAVQQWL